MSLSLLSFVCQACGGKNANQSWPLASAGCLGVYVYITGTVFWSFCLSDAGAQQGAHTRTSLGVFVNNNVLLLTSISVTFLSIKKTDLVI